MTKTIYLTIFSFFFTCSPVIAYDHELAVCSMFQNEAPFLQEWIEFYKLIGVQHFYLYNNNSTDNYQTILEPYISNHEVDLIQWNHSNANLKAQAAAFNHCLNKVRGKVKWIAFLDLDEFLFPVEHDNLHNFLKDYEKYGAVCANWIMFGTSDIDEIPKNTLMIESLTMRDQSVNKHVKSIVQPEKVRAVNSHAPTAFYSNFFQVTPNKVQFSGPFSPELNIDKLRINHYWTRDKKWLREIKIPRVEALKENLMAGDDTSWYLPCIQARSLTPTDWTLKIANCMNQKEDLTIQRFVEPLKKNIKIKYNNKKGEKVLNNK